MVTRAHTVKLNDEIKIQNTLKQTKVRHISNKRLHKSTVKTDADAHGHTQTQ
jgi:hypothetical protein